MAAPMHLPKLNICIYNQFCTNSPRYSRRETISQLILWDSKTRLGHYKKSVQASIFSEHICRQSKKKNIKWDPTVYKNHTSKPNEFHPKVQSWENLCHAYEQTNKPKDHICWWRKTLDNMLCPFQMESFQSPKHGRALPSWWKESINKVKLK